MLEAARVVLAYAAVVDWRIDAGTALRIQWAALVSAASEQQPYQQRRDEHDSPDKKRDHRRHEAGSITAAVP